MIKVFTVGKLSIILVMHSVDPWPSDEERIDNLATYPCTK